jgi:hypothetical protein
MMLRNANMGDPVNARYGPFSTINLIRKIGELAFSACIFIQNNINSTYHLKNIAMQEFEQKWWKSTPWNPRHKSTNQSERAVQPHMDQRAHQSRKPT